jgi:hypothetical protein
MIISKKSDGVLSCRYRCGDSLGETDSGVGTEDYV